MGTLEETLIMKSLQWFFKFSLATLFIAPFSLVQAQTKWDLAALTL